MLEALELKSACREIKRLAPAWRFSRSDLPRSGCIGPQQLLPVLGADRQQPLAMQWGLIGHFLDHPPLHPVLSLPAAGLDRRPFYNRIFRRGRCLVPLTAWRLQLPRQRGQTRLSAAGRPLLCAALCDEHPCFGLSVALLTVPASHGWPRGSDQQPWILPPAATLRWLQEEGAEEAGWLDEMLAQAAPIAWESEQLPPPEISPQLTFAFA